ncbi:MAG: TadE/TadG family type IV pilus assembly protein [Rhodospirillales bacterium]
MMRLVRRLRRLRRDDAGAIFVEMAFILPVLILMLTGGAEVARYVLLNQRLDRVASTMADLVSQSDDTLTAAQVDDLFDAVEEVAKPFTLAATGRVILSSVTGQSGGTSLVNWQRTTGSLTGAASKVGSPNNTATLPTGFALVDGDTAIIAEVYFDYTPLIFGGVMADRRVYHSAFYRPRFGALSQLN